MSSLVTLKLQAFLLSEKSLYIFQKYQSEAVKTSYWFKLLIIWKKIRINVLKNVKSENAYLKNLTIS